MNRREFVQQAIVAGAATSLLSSSEALAKGVTWQIGCFNRPWTKWTFDQTLKEINAAGFKTPGLLTRTKEEPFIGADATPEYHIIYYTGKDPVAEIDPIAQHVTGFCAKDCGELKGDVMIQFGSGRVDFPAVFRKLRSAGFDGPVMVECCKVGQTPEETTANARANREFLEKVLAST